MHLPIIKQWSKITKFHGSETACAFSKYMGIMNALRVENPKLANAIHDRFKVEPDQIEQNALKFAVKIE